MIHTFYGPWVIGELEIIGDTHWTDFQLTVANSAGADASYTPAEDFSLLVDGDTWTLGAWFRTSTGWRELDDLRPFTSFDRQSNLTVQLTVVGRVPRTVAITARCRSQDPALNPDPQGDPYDFSLPDG